MVPTVRAQWTPTEAATASPGSDDPGTVVDGMRRDDGGATVGLAVARRRSDRWIVR
jgi:hypothetical protein